MNKLIRSLGLYCKEHLLSEKFLVCPSLRTGQTWLDRTALLQNPVINVRLRTLKGLAFELADNHLRENNLKPINQSQALIMMNEVMSRLGTFETSYFSGARVSISLISGLIHTIETIRLAGLTAEKIKPEDFDVLEKGKNIQFVLAEYENALKRVGMVDYADILKLAIQQTAEKFQASADRFILFPDDTDNTRLEKDFLNAVPPESLLILETDTRETRISEGVKSDSDLLVHFMDPSAAPSAQGDGTAEIFQALGPSNEIREVFRRILNPGNTDVSKSAIPFDHIEILHTDFETYVPAIYQTLSSLMMSIDPDFETLPVAFAEGIPVRFSRPARALNAWLGWMENDYPQTLLVDMISDGLLGWERSDVVLSNSDIAQTLRKFRIVSGLDRSIQIPRARLEELKKMAGHSPDEDYFVPNSNSAQHYGINHEINCLEKLLSILEKLGECSQMEGLPAKKQLINSVTFLRTCAGSDNEMDNYALKALLINLEELREALVSTDSSIDMDVPAWISGLTDRVRIMGTGPRPGMIYVDNICSGGHSGRPQTFILGMDDQRFPGTGTHDPLLMDVEREKISRDLPQMKLESGKRLERFGSLLSRLRGKVALSYSCLDMYSDRPGFPGSVLFSIFRMLSNQRDADQTGMIDWLGLPASFTTTDGERALTQIEWLLSANCGADVSNKNELLASLKPDVFQGLTAAGLRLSDDFTAYDGNIGALEHKHDPTHPTGPVMSSASLETLASCPLKYFFKYVIRIRPTDNIDVDQSKWLDNLQLGSLLHETFFSFMTQLSIERRHPNFQRDKSRLFKILNQQLDVLSVMVPPPNRSSVRRQVIWLEKSALVFMVEEEIASRNWNPVLLEASIGMKNIGITGTFEHKEPVRFELSRDRFVRIAGKVDRIDQRSSELSAEFRVIDYKTGNPRIYQDAKNYERGKILQHALYLRLAQVAMRNQSPFDPGSYDFVFFFPTVRGHGIRITKSPADVQLCVDVIGSLCEIASNGIFIPTNDAKTCTYCEYGLICGEGDMTAMCSANKLSNVSNVILEPARKIFLND